jgi:hypothetical protein
MVVLAMVGSNWPLRPDACCRCGQDRWRYVTNLSQPGLKHTRPRPGEPAGEPAGEVPAGRRPRRPAAQRAGLPTQGVGGGVAGGFLLEVAGGGVVLVLAPRGVGLDGQTVWGREQPP